jgi:hypothetical protein
MDRDMSYDLDAAMASRNDGEMQNLAPARTRLARSPGVRVMQPNDLDSDSERTLLALPENQQPHDSPANRSIRGRGASAADGLALDLPFIGSVNLVHIGLAVGATLLICKMMKKNG